MSSRALIPATVLLLVGWLTPALAQENLDAGKTPSQIFAGTCTACHKSPRGLLKTVSPSSLQGFLRQHYTTSPNMAGLLASYLISNGATDTRIGGDTPKGEKAARGAKEGAKQEARQEARPEGKPDGRPEQADRWGRRGRPAPQEGAEPKPEGEAKPAQAAVEPAVEGRKNAKQKWSRHGKPGEALPKEEPKAIERPGETPSETATREEPKVREDKPREEKPREQNVKEEAKPEAARPAEATKPAEEGRSQSAKVEPPAETPAVPPDPVPQVTPASSAATAPSTATEAPAAASAVAAPAPVQAAVANPATEMAVPLPANAVPLPPPATATASVPLPPPVAPAGPPAPPISQ